MIYPRQRCYVSFTLLFSTLFPVLILATTVSLLSLKRRDIHQVTVPCRRDHTGPEMSAQDEGYQIALQEAKIAGSEGEITVGACIVSKNGTVIGRGRNTRYSVPCARISSS